MKVVDQELVELPIAELRRHPLNPRRGNTASIKESIRENGFYGFVVVQKSTNYVLAGWHRLKEAIGLGATRLTVMVLDVDDRTARRILLVDNRANDLADYNDAVLAEVLQDMDGDLEGTGYDRDAVQAVLEKLDVASHRAARVPKPRVVVGPHRIKITVEELETWEQQLREVTDGDDERAAGEILRRLTTC